MTPVELEETPWFPLTQPPVRFGPYKTLDSEGVTQLAYWSGEWEQEKGAPLMPIWRPACVVAWKGLVREYGTNDQAVEMLHHIVKDIGGHSSSNWSLFDAVLYLRTKLQIEKYLRDPKPAEERKKWVS